MPVKIKREKRVVLDEDQIRFFRDGTDHCFFWDERERKRDWRAAREEILADWIRDYAGSRPWAWWKYDAPAPRLRVGGKGSLIPANDCSDNLRFGIPRRSAFVCDRLLAAWNKLDCASREYQVYDENDPPAFESEASFLKRHRLFLPGEAARLTDADFAPEAVR